MILLLTAVSLSAQANQSDPSTSSVPVEDTQSPFLSDQSAEVQVPNHLFLPATFDGRKDPRWQDCLDNFEAPQNTTACDMSWAVSAANVLAHRFCIQQGEEVNLSGEYVAECQPNVQCNGGYPELAWNFLSTVGTPSTDCVPVLNHTGACPGTCSDGDSLTFYSSSSAQWLTSKMSIQLAIMMKGPVQSCFNMYQDFLTYRKGVYVRNSTVFVQRVCVEIIGWNSGAQSYWIGVGMMGRHWGMDGYFYYEMNQVAGIESEVIVADAGGIYN